MFEILFDILVALIDEGVCPVEADDIERRFLIKILIYINGYWFGNEYEISGGSRERPIRWGVHEAILLPRFPTIKFSGAWRRDTNIVVRGSKEIWQKFWWLVIEFRPRLKDEYKILLEIS